MRRNRIPLLWVAVLLLLATGCGQQQSEEKIQLYFAASDETYYGEAIVGEDFMGDTADGVDIIALMTTLLDGPTGILLKNPFPAGTEILWAGWRTDGVLVVNLSEEYSGLMGIDLTLADYCIVKTLCQIEGVTEVEILAANQTIPLRNHQILSVSDLS